MKDKIPTVAERNAEIVRGGTPLEGIEIISNIQECFRKIYEEDDKPGAVIMNEIAYQQLINSNKFYIDPTITGNIEIKYIFGIRILRIPDNLNLIDNKHALVLTESALKLLIGEEPPKLEKELKTMKDLQRTYSNGMVAIDPIEARDAGITWAKRTKEQAEKNSGAEVNTTIWCNYISMKTQLHFIKQLFDLTEEDIL